jgi:hypothetical protein
MSPSGQRTLQNVKERQKCWDFVWDLVFGGKTRTDSRLLHLKIRTYISLNLYFGHRLKYVIIPNVCEPGCNIDEDKTIRACSLRNSKEV